MFKIRRSDNTPEVAVTISTGTFIRLTLLTIASLILLLAVKKAEHAFVLIFISFFLALALNGPVIWISKFIPGKMKHNLALATSLSYLFVIILLGIFIASIVPPLVKQTDTLIKEAPHLLNEFRGQNGAVGNFIRHYHLQNEIHSLSKQLSSRLSNISGNAFSEAKSVSSSFFSLVTILALTFMMIVEGPKWLRIINDILPERHHATAAKLGADMYAVIRGFVNGQVLLAALAAVLIMPAVLLLHIGFAAGILVIIFICGLIPLIGHTIGAIIVTTIALFHNVTSAVIILAYYITYQQIENYLIQPRIQANSTNMSPLLVFSSVIIGVNFGGLLGGLVAIPIAGCLRIAVLEYLYSRNIINAPKIKDPVKEATK
ncbi:MAG TPA: AI-2E family transporter [Candidatus Saccharimonadales bacterium]|nr:AI-2E family transporter [Candidatus Saccharimonadales bacterium]